ncbi:hypothetical protein Dda_7571 [Drechslerella dactyloides]|uniref:Exonuclease domain-containing protein n=1 Tax=Drechslerella dactyloides TaxID=74499 RepID=A0AAD6NGY6_DREDA|nr:hypothetical protein Dda_7571 [Drechslerella dactyloides]
MGKSKKRSRRGDRKKASEHSKAPESPLPELPSFDPPPTFTLVTAAPSTRKRSIHDVASDDDAPAEESAKRHCSQSPSKAEASTGDGDDDGWQQVPFKHTKARSTTYPELQLSSSRIHTWVKISDIQSLLLHLLADEATPQWLSVRNKNAVRHVVCLHVPGLAMDLFNGGAKLTTSDGGESPAKPSSKLAEYFPVPINERTLPSPLEALAGIFTHVLPVKAGGDNHKVFSPSQNMLNVPVPEEKEQSNRKKPRHKRTPKPRLKITELLLTPEELVENEYPPHSTQSTDRSSLTADWLETDLSNAPPRIVESGSILEGYTIYAVDCEMVTTASGPSLARISIVDWDSAVVLDELVQPDEPVLDYLTPFSGITAAKLANITTTRADIQRRLSTLLTANTILVGQSLNSDLHALRFSHPLIVDTSVIYDHPRGKPMKPGLRWLAGKYLKQQIQHNASGHDSIEDARACLQLVKLKLERGKEFGSTSSTLEPLFARLARVQPRPVTSGIVDTAADVEKRYAATAQYTRKAHDDDSVVAGVLTAVNGDTLAGIPPVTFTYAHLQSLADARGWNNSYGKFIAQMNGTHMTATSPAIEIPSRPPPPAPEQLAEAVRETAGRIRRVYEGLPKCSVLVVFSGTGDPVEMGRLNAVQTVYRREFKVKKWDECSVRWTDDEEQALKVAVGEARKGIALLAVK